MDSQKYIVFAHICRQHIDNQYSPLVLHKTEYQARLVHQIRYQVLFVSQYVLLGDA